MADQEQYSGVRQAEKREGGQEAAPIVLPCLYMAPAAYYARLVEAGGRALIDTATPFERRTPRNRTRIATANKVMELSIPIDAQTMHKPMAEVAISYGGNWQKDHWHAIESAYGKSPYFEYYAEWLYPYYSTETRLLSDFNLGLHKTVMHLMQLDEIGKQTRIAGPGCAPTPGPGADYRRHFCSGEPLEQLPPYSQVFERKFGFQQGLGIMDLLFNLGPEAYRYLKIEK